MKSMVNWSFSVILIFAWRIQDLAVASDQNTVIVHETTQCLKIYQCSDNCANNLHEVSLKCSCHPYCELFGDCCYNSEDYERLCHNQNDPERLMLFDVLSEFVNYFQCIFDEITSQKYWMISKCPQSWNGLARCEDGRNIVGRLEENLTSIPVVTINGVTYKNIYCAVCHGEDLQNITPWSFQGEKCLNDAEGIGTNQTIKDIVHSLRENCKKLFFGPPFDHMYHLISMVPCREVTYDVIDTCDESLSDTTNSIKCPTVTAPLKVDGKVFKNRYCAECYYELKRNETVRINEVCAGPHAPEGRDKCSLSPPLRTCFCQESPTCKLVPISITFDFGGSVSLRKDKKNIKTTKVTCAIGQVFDPIASSCVHLSCPKGYVINGDQCLHFSVVPTNNSSWYCKELELQIDVLPTKDMFHDCESYLKQIYSCLPPDISLLLQTNVDNTTLSCQGTKLTLRMWSLNFKVVELLFKFSTNSNYYSNHPHTCESFDVIIISGQCYIYDVGNSTWQCEQEWQNISQWQFDGKNQEVLLKEGSEELKLLEARFQHSFSFHSKTSVSETIRISKCSLKLEKILCSFILLDESFFKYLENGSETLVYVQDDNLKFSRGEYVRYNNGTVHVCNFFNDTGEVRFVFYPKYHTVLEGILSTIGICFSIFALSITLLTYLVFPSLRTRLANIIIMNLCACLIIAQMMLLFAGLATSLQEICAMVAGLGYFFWMAVFSTSSVLGFILDRTFAGINETSRGKKPSKSEAILYMFVCFCGPATFSVTLLILFLTKQNHLDITYGTKSGCWIGGSKTSLCAFGVPVAFCLILNIYFFCHVTVSIFKRRRSCQRITKTTNRKQVQDLLVYAKIFMVLGLTWVVGFVAAFTKVQFLWYIFTVLTSLQGVFIFFAFTFNSRIWIMWKEKINYLNPSTNSTIMMRSTGQSK